jgi:hypothetical protein
VGSLRNPVGSLAPAVYWRRRVLVALAVVAVLAAVLYACSGSGSGKKQSKGTGSPTASQSSLPTGTGTGTSSPTATGGASGATSATVSASSGGTSGGPTSAGGVNGGVVGTSGGATGGSPGGGPTGGTAGGATGATGGPGCQLSLSLTSQASAYANGVDPQFTVAVVNKGTTDCDVDVSPKALVLNIYSGQDHVWSSADCATGGKDLRGIAPGAVQTITYTWNRTRSSQGCPPNAGSAALGMYFGVATLGPGSGPNAPAALSQPKSFELKTGS